MSKLSKGWDTLPFWQTGENQVIEERLDAFDHDGVEYNPRRSDLYRVLNLVEYERVSAVIVGQDPYPTAAHATGVAFATPAGLTKQPPTLVNLFKEYQDDLGYPAPKNGDLTKWCEQGVLLWNKYPVCLQGKPGSCHWIEWELLNQELMEKLNERRDLVFILLGSSAGSLGKYITPPNCVIRTSHPSPLGVRRGFLGSKIFSRCNEELVKLGKKPIDWRLPDANETQST